MKRGIVITTSEHTKDFLEGCLKSLFPCDYPILIVSNGGYIPKLNPFNFLSNEADLTSFEEKVTLVVNDWNGFELGGILGGSQVFDEFIHIMDSCEIKDKEMIKSMFDEEGSVYLCNGFFSYLGKYRTVILNEVGIPEINNKEEAIKLERDWNAKYLAADKSAKQFHIPLPITTDVFVEKYGRKNMVLDNSYIIKYKATYR